MAKNSKNKEKKRLIRIPFSVDKALIKRAKEQNRSINSQIIHELKPGPFVFIPDQSTSSEIREANIALTGHE